MKSSLRISIIAVLALFSIESYSVVGSFRPSLNLPIHDDEDCAMRSNNGSASQLSEISDMIHQAAWQRDFNNSMSPVSATEGAGGAVATIMTHRSNGQAVQVCPGVYVANAHILLDPPNGPSGNGPLWHLSAYPMTSGNITGLPDKSTFLSPRLNNANAWSDPKTDYVFFRVDNPPNTEVLTPVRASATQIASGNFKTHLYRPRTRYQENADGTPNFDTELVGGQEMMDRYQTPYKVDQACEMIDPGNVDIMHTTCPTEDGVSGSPYVYEGENKNYLVGLHAFGSEAYFDSYETRDQGANGLIQSEHFCDDFQSMCGEPCAVIDEVLPQTDDGVAI